MPVSYLKMAQSKLVFGEYFDWKYLLQKQNQIFGLYIIVESHSNIMTLIALLADESYDLE